MSKSKHACISTKALAMRARKIQESDYLELIKAKDLKEVFLYLRDYTYFGDFLRKMDPENLHRTDIEAHLNDLKVQETEKLMHYLSGVEKNFFQVLLVRMEVESLRILIRGIARNDELEQLKGLMVYSEKYTKVPFGRLFRAKDWDEFKKLLIDTDYYRILEIYKDIKGAQDLVMVEKNLDRYYYDLLKNRLVKLDKKSNRDLIDLERRNFDLLNLIWIYRGKKFYSLSREELIAYSLRGGLELNEKRLLSLVNAKNLVEIKAQLVNSDYAFLFNHTKTIDLFMERRRERYLYYQYLNLFGKSDSGLGRVVGYVRLLDFEIEDITSIIESKRYRMGPEETKKYLIRPID
ncbi:V-type ATPase subunit [Acetobacterium sp.]|uniref:V-type ATPase subunit n=1 Tax=Acetobacterium sp. TaxID=1872094 RepID=UPI0035934071